MINQTGVLKSKVYDSRLANLMPSKYTIWLTIIVYVSVLVISFGLDNMQIAEARTEQHLDGSNNKLMISMEAPDSWNSGTISQTIANLDWRLNGLNAMNDDMRAFFIVVNSPSFTNIALPLGQKTGIISYFLSQYVTINSELDFSLSDGSSGHRYSISLTPEQLHRLNAPIDKGYDAILITTKQQDTTYIIGYASELGMMSEFEAVFQNILNSVKFGSVSILANPSSSIPTNQNLFSGQGNMSANMSAPEVLSQLDIDLGNNTQILENDTNVDDLSNTLLDPSIQ